MIIDLPFSSDTHTRDALFGDTETDVVDIYQGCRIMYVSRGKRDPPQDGLACTDHQVETS